MMKVFAFAAFAVVAAGAFAQSCCADKGGAPTDAHSRLQAFDAEDAHFLATAAAMKAKADQGEKGGKESCCTSTAGKPVAKFEAGCCNEKGELAKFKVYVAGEGYKFFGCKDSAGKGRSDLVASNKRVGKIQSVSGKVRI